MRRKPGWPGTDWRKWTDAAEAWPAPRVPVWMADVADHRPAELHPCNSVGGSRWLSFSWGAVRQRSRDSVPRRQWDGPVLLRPALTFDGPGPELTRHGTVKKTVSALDGTAVFESHPRRRPRGHLAHRLLQRDHSALLHVAADHAHVVAVRARMRQPESVARAESERRADRRPGRG